MSNSGSQRVCPGDNRVDQQVKQQTEPDSDISLASKRTRTMTEKGLEMYQTQTSQFKTELSKLTQAIQYDLMMLDTAIQNNDHVTTSNMKDTLLNKLSMYNRASDGFTQFLERTNTTQSKVDLSSHRENILSNAIHGKVESAISQVDQITTVDNAPVSAGSKHSFVPSEMSSQKSHSSSSSLNAMLVKQRVKTESARAKLKYAEKMARIKKEKALLEEDEKLNAARATRKRLDLDTDLDLLKQEQEIAQAEAGLEAIMLASSGGSGASSLILRLPIDKSELTKEYVQKQNIRLKGSVNVDQDYEMPQSEIGMSPKTLFNPQFPYHPSLHEFESYKPTPGTQHDKFRDSAVNQRDTCIEVPPADIHFPSHKLNPNALPFPQYPQPMNDMNNNSSVFADLTKFLLKKDLLLSRFTNFNDQPESYAVWKASFTSIVRELTVSPSEELDLLVKWLGPESSKCAISLRTANASNPVRGLARVWDRLDERYGGAEKVESTLKKKLASFPKLTNKDYKKLYELSDILSEVESIKEVPRYSALLSYYDTSSGINPIVSKLPYNLQTKWMDRALKYKRTHSVTFPPFAFFVEFIREMSTNMNDPGFVFDSGKQIKEDKVTSHPLKGNYKMALAAKKTDVLQQPKHNIERNTTCPLHKTPHSLNECRGFKLKPTEERKQFLMDNRICFKCCESDEHVYRTCKESVKCNDCGSTKHATAMHIKNFKLSSPQEDGGEKHKSKEEDVSSKCTAVCGKGFSGRSCAKTLLVYVFPNRQPNKAVKVYAIIDDQSNRSLAKTQLLDQLNVEGERIQYTLSSCSGNIVTSGRRANGFTVQSLDGSTSMELPTLVECNEIPNDRSEIPTPQVASNFPHLKDIANSLPPLDPDAEIQLLIGRDLVRAHHVLEQRIGPSDMPFAQRFNLGWVIIGDVCLGKVHKTETIRVSKTYVLKDDRGTIFEPCKNNLFLKERRNNEMFETELSESHDNLGASVFVQTKDDNKIGKSVEDKQFLKIMDSGFKKNSAGNWTAPLPFRPGRPKLPNNRPQALKRAQILDRSLRKDPAKRQHFVTFMQQVIDSGAAEVVPPVPENKECWYLPLFGVYHPRKPDRIRGVFDSSAEYEGVSLNSVLLTGPDLINNLLGVLLRFRRDEYAITGDIEQMFYSFFVREDHRDYLRFLWYKDNDPDSDLTEYRMCVHVFGNSPSPAVAIYGLSKSVQNSEHIYGKDVTEFVMRNFYVDDGLVSLPTSAEAIDLMKRTKKALEVEGNIRLHKISSNSSEVISAFNADDLSKDLKCLNIGEDDLPQQSSLGLVWDLNRDKFVFKITPDNKPFTHRGVLSTLNSLFDPMGFIAPVVIHGKILLREIMNTNGGFTWDEPLPPECQSKWKNWKDSLSLLEDLEIPRMYVPASLTSVDYAAIHIYSDASEKAISAVAYVKTVDKKGSSHVGFIMGKSKVAPSRGHTIPRLELCAAVLATEVAEVILDNFDITCSSVTYYTDSKVVLGYINNTRRRFYTYVSNRVERIHRVSKPAQWKYVPTFLNPADQGTRGLSSENIRNSLWLCGPPSLAASSHTSECDATSDQDDFELINPDEDKELRPHIIDVQTCKTGVNLEESFSKRFQKFSDWRKLLNAISFLKRVAKHYKNGEPTAKRNVESYVESEHFIVKVVQTEFYRDEIKCISKEKRISEGSPILQLNPVLDKTGILRVGGRLSRAEISLHERNPIILPGKSHIAKLLVHFYHQKVKHQGRHFTEGAVRSAGYWIIGAKRLISSVIFSCVKCRKLRGKLLCQKMADLPVDRLTPCPPFLRVGVDTFGPWLVTARKTRGLAQSKRWAILFSYLSTRAIHIEVVEELSSSAFINALPRFVSIRGEVKEFRSDRGTNFVGATDDLNIQAINVEDGPVGDFLCNKGTIWIFNPPHSSHMGGVWERMIGITRRILDSMLLDISLKNLSHEVLATFMAEVCAIVNSRPITPISSDSEAPSFLSPSMLLTQKTGYDSFVYDHPACDDIKFMYKAQWRHVQILSDMFWKRWKNEYLNTLQCRRKWNEDKPNIKKGDIILLKNDSDHRNNWPLGLVTNAIESQDGKVRKAEVKICKDGKSCTYTRPITEMVLLVD